MSLNEMKDLARRSLALWDSDCGEPVDDIVTTDYVNHQEPLAAGGEAAVGLEAWRAVIESYHQGFSQSKVRILSAIAEGDTVATHWEFSATHSGDYLGLAATGKTVTWRGITMDRIRDGKVAETWTAWDKYGFFEGLGLIS